MRAWSSGNSERAVLLDEAVSHARMEQRIAPLFLDYEHRRKSEEARAADAQDEAELQALENRLKNRKEAGA